jgi:hypothetical protein
MVTTVRDERYDVDSPPEREVDILRRAVELVERRLPQGWSVSLRENVQTGGVQIDAEAVLTAPAKGSATLIFEAKRSLVTANLPGMLDQLHRYASLVDSSARPAVPVIVARYLGLAARTWLERKNVSYADATGNMRLVVDRPAIFLHDRGADRDPWRGPGRPRGTLVGPPAARVVRALVDYAAPMTVPTLVRLSGASTGAAYRVVGFLAGEGLIARSPKSPITTVDWRGILERWSQDYGFQRNNIVRGYLEPRGPAAFTDRLAQSHGLRYALTGSLAVQRLAPHAPPRLAMVYVDDIQHVANELGLQAIETGANILLAAGDYDVSLDRTVNHDGLICVAPSQAAVDLLTGPGRGPSEAIALLDWMGVHEGEWRH